MDPISVCPNSLIETNFIGLSKERKRSVLFRLYSLLVFSCAILAYTYINGCNVAGTTGLSCIRRRNLFDVVEWCHTGVAWLDAYQSAT
jgi:hypothetical protein